MTVVYRCKRCGAVLYVLFSREPNTYGVLTPSEVMDRYGGLCPVCGHRLEKPSISDITIRLYPTWLREELQRITILRDKSEIAQITKNVFKPVYIELSSLDLRLSMPRRQEANA